MLQPWRWKRSLESAKSPPSCPSVSGTFPRSVFANYFFLCRFSMYLLLHDRWHEGGTDDGRFPIYTYVRRGFQCSHLRRRGEGKLLRNLEDSRRRRKDKLGQVSTDLYISVFFSFQNMHCSFDPDPTVRHSWFTLIIGGGITFLSLYAVNQTQVQRYLTVKDLKKAQQALWLNWPILSALSLSTSFSGLAIYSRYFKCDPYDAKQINSFDQVCQHYMNICPTLSAKFSWK